MKILSVVGARPNLIKIAPFIAAIRRFNESTERSIDYMLVHTGQHYDVEMSEVFFTELGIPSPDINLEVGSGTHSWQTAEVMKRFEPVLKREEPDVVAVVGDVNSTLACSLVVSKADSNGRGPRPRLVHIEAGLRSYDRTMPEEVNRIITDALSDLLFTPSSDANENLRKEGIPEERIRLVGNIMIDTLVANLDLARARHTHEKLGLKARGFIYVTLHRPSNVDKQDSLEKIMEDLRRLSSEWPVVFPLHPRTRKKIAEFGLNRGNPLHFLLVEPVGYHDSICLAEQARLVITDSGGLQEETTFLRTPCLTLRPNTERPVTINQGSNRLSSPDRLPEDVEGIQPVRTTGRNPSPVGRKNR